MVSEWVFKKPVVPRYIVLILVLVEDGLGASIQILEQLITRQKVLILVLVEDGLGDFLNQTLNL